MAEVIRVCIDPEQAQPPKDVNLRMAFMKDHGWGSGHKLTVRFLGGEPAVQEKVKKYAKQWADHANINIVFPDSGDADVRISFDPGGSWSQVGTMALGVTNQSKPTMNFGWLDANTADDEYSRVVLHEFGHALGCIHEHQHPAGGIKWNKPAVYEYYKKQGWDKDRVDRNIFQTYDENLLRRTAEVDRASIMMYPIPKELLDDPSQEVGWNRDLSKTDKDFIGELYP